MRACIALLAVTAFSVAFSLARRTSQHGLVDAEHLGLVDGKTPEFVDALNAPRLLYCFAILEVGRVACSWKVALAHQRRQHIEATSLLKFSSVTEPILKGRHNMRMHAVVAAHWAVDFCRFAAAQQYNHTFTCYSNAIPPRSELCVPNRGKMHANGHCGRRIFQPRPFVLQRHLRCNDGA